MSPLDSKPIGIYGCLDSRVVFALNFWTLVHYALCSEVTPRWQELFFGPKQNIYAWFHDFFFIYLNWYYIICMSYLSLNCETENKQNLFFKNHWNLSDFYCLHRWFLWCWLIIQMFHNFDVINIKLYLVDLPWTRLVLKILKPKSYSPFAISCKESHWVQRLEVKVGHIFVLIWHLLRVLWLV